MNLISSHLKCLLCKAVIHSKHYCFLTLSCVAHSRFYHWCVVHLFSAFQRERSERGLFYNLAVLLFVSAKFVNDATVIPSLQVHHFPFYCLLTSSYNSFEIYLIRKAKRFAIRSREFCNFIRIPFNSLNVRLNTRIYEC